jgi:hypothetical protein
MNSLVSKKMAKDLKLSEVELMRAKLRQNLIFGVRVNIKDTEDGDDN